MGKAVKSFDLFPILKNTSPEKKPIPRPERFNDLNKFQYSTLVYSATDWKDNSLTFVGKSLQGEYDQLNRYDDYVQQFKALCKIINIFLIFWEDWKKENKKSKHGKHVRGKNMLYFFTNYSV